ncbi:MAG: hypothetical protein V8Q27_10275 [Eubacteriales bacterium]
MRTIQAKPITRENFKSYGEIVDMFHPDCWGFGAGTELAFFPDALTLPMGNNNPPSVCICPGEEKRKYHNQL